jgi:hypothetical protein
MDGSNHENEAHTADISGRKRTIIFGTERRKINERIEIEWMTVPGI